LSGGLRDQASGVGFLEASPQPDRISYRTDVRASAASGLAIRGYSVTITIKKQDIRRNPLAEYVGAVLRFVLEKRKVVLGAVGGLVIVACLVAGYWWYQEEQEEKASRILAGAFTAVREEQPGPAPSTNGAAKRFRDLVQQYPRTRSAEEALIALGNLQYGENKIDEALGTFSEYLSAFPRGRFRIMAGLGKAYAQEAKGDLQGGVKTLSDLLDRYKDDPLAGEAYSSLARLYEGLNKTEDAMRVYGQITERYPQSQWAQRALQRMSLLKK